MSLSGKPECFYVVLEDTVFWQKLPRKFFCISYLLIPPKKGLKKWGGRGIKLKSAKDMKIISRIWVTKRAALE